MHRERWSQLMQSLAFNANDIAFTRLQKAYQEPQRVYHSAEHSNDCLRLMDEYVDFTGNNDDRLIVELAIWFHDAIYNTRSGHNERDSAAWARQFLQSNHADPALVSTTQDLIMCTVPQAIPTGPLQQQMKDIDLAILGAAPEQYQRFETDIRQEYHWVPRFIFNRKRREILQGFLNRPSVFYCTPFQQAFEQQARHNLVRAIKSLS